MGVHVSITLSRAALFGISVFLFAVYILLVAVVIMLLMSALHVVNPELFAFKEFGLVPAMIIIPVLLISVRVFLKGYRKIYSMAQGIISRDISQD
jgi:hypothetical protein